ncbi:MAG: hypothetical protein O2782_15595 [bacterium]|nr:hypothetical protein [bacterium]
MTTVRARGWLMNLLLATVATGVTLAAAELLLRMTSTVERVTIAYDPLLGFAGSPHAATIWTREMAGAPRTVQLNAGGFHDHERSLEVAADTRRLVFVGDSFLEAYQVDIDSSFAQRLARQLTERCRNQAEEFSVEVVNQGVHGYGLGVYALHVRERLPAWDADGVVLCLFLGNDLHDNFTPVASPAVPRFHVDNGHVVYLPVAAADGRVWLRDHILTRSMLVRFLWMRVLKKSDAAMHMARTAGMVSTPDLEQAAIGRTAAMLTVADYLLRRIVDDLRARNVPLHVLLIPDPFHVNDLVHAVQAERSGTPPSAPQAERQAIESGMLQILQQLGLGYTYPRAAFVQARLHGDGYYRNGFGHLTDAAHRVVAELLEQPLWDLVSEPGAAR